MCWSNLLYSFSLVVAKPSSNFHFQKYHIILLVDLYLHFHIKRHAAKLFFFSLHHIIKEGLLTDWRIACNYVLVLHVLNWTCSTALEFEIGGGRRISDFSTMRMLYNIGIQVIEFLHAKLSFFYSCLFWCFSLWVNFFLHMSRIMFCVTEFTYASKLLTSHVWQQEYTCII